MASHAIDLIQIISELMKLLPPAIYCPQPPLQLLNIYSISLVPVLLLDRSHARWQNVPSKGFQPSASAATLVSFLLDRSRSSACSLPTLSLAFSRMCASYVLGTGRTKGGGGGDTGTTLARRLSVPDLFPPATHRSPVACRSPTLSPHPPLLLFCLHLLHTRTTSSQRHSRAAHPKKRLSRGTRTGPLSRLCIPMARIPRTNMLNSSQAKC